MTSRSRVIHSQSRKIVKFVIFMALFFSECESTCYLTDIAASIYDKKTGARPFDTIKVIQQSLDLAQSLLKG